MRNAKEWVIPGLTLIIAVVWAATFLVELFNDDPASDGIRSFLAVVGGVLIGIVAHHWGVRTGARGNGTAENLMKPGDFAERPGQTMTEP